MPDFVRATAPSAAMLEAIRERRASAIRYVDPRDGKPSRRTIEPVGLVCPFRGGRVTEYWTVAKEVEAIGAWISAGRT